ncbi:hypothetical protein ACFRAR_29500 [Kitasatospora sp. NPDC056651]|uniref:hypothetical protein n=1 Tax=Kitasatospora sp. NPDC056651 TaxID=3345892 RepID=UPI00369D3281
MPHSFLGVPAVLCPSTGYLAGSLLIGLAAAREIRAGTRGGGAGWQWTAVVWTMPGFVSAMTFNPYPQGTAARFLSAAALGAAGNAALLALGAHALGLGRG